MRGLLALGLVTLCAVGVATGGDAKQDAAKLEGKWVGETKGIKIEMTLTKDKFTFSFGDKATFKGTYKIDPAKKPREIDMKITDGPMFTDKTAKAIYELNGDTLKWCGSEPGSDARPKDFKDTDDNHLNIVFKRVK
jgi:uncharacterized protein (TIGR03067 family)